VKPETAAFLAKSHECLAKADGMLAQWPDEAGRAAYLAGFHAAQALIFELQGRSPKTHNGVQGQFARLVKDEPAISLEMRAFLGRTYNLKAIADYETGPGSKVTTARATEAIVDARRFVAAVAALIPEGTAP
jgi:uncharacterized protein (UPF0332 family)